MNLGPISLSGALLPASVGHPASRLAPLAPLPLWLPHTSGPVIPSLPYKYSEPSCPLQCTVQTLWLAVGDLAPGLPSSIPTWNGNLALPLKRRLTFKAQPLVTSPSPAPRPNSVLCLHPQLYRDTMS